MLDWLRGHPRAAIAFAALGGLYAIPIVLSGRPYIDDLGRSQWGYTGWTEVGRPLAENVMVILNGGTTLSDLSPLTQLCAVALVCVCCYLLFIWTKDFKVPDGLRGAACALFLLNPFLLENLSYKFDSLTMALSLLGALLAIRPPTRHTPLVIAYGAAMTIATLALYQAAVNVSLAAAILFAVVEKGQGHSSASVLRTLLLRLSAIAGGYLIYAVTVGRWLAVSGYALEHALPVELTADGLAIFAANNFAAVQFIWDSFDAIQRLLLVPLLAASVAYCVDLAWRTLREPGPWVMRLGVALIVVAAPALIFAASFGVSAALKTPVFAPRVFMAFGVTAAFAALTGLRLVFIGRNFPAGPIRSSLTALASVVVLAPALVTCLTVAFAFGAAQSAQREFDTSLASRIKQGMAVIGVSKPTLLVDGVMPYAPVAKHQLLRFPVLRSLVPLYLNEDWWWGVQMLDYYGVDVSTGTNDPAAIARAREMSADFSGGDFTLTHVSGSVVLRFSPGETIPPTTQITTDGAIGLSGSAFSALESEGVATVSVVRSGDLSRPVTVDYAMTDGTATSGKDFGVTGNTVTIPAGVSSVAIRVPILNDSLSEATEEFGFSIVNTSPPTSSIGLETATVAILDDESPIPEPAEPPLNTSYSVSVTDEVTGLWYPMSVEWVPNTNYALVAEKGGAIVVADMASGTREDVILDISGKVNAASDRGLMDIALSPELDKHPYLYAYYIVDPPDTVDAEGEAGRDKHGNRFAYVSRFTLDLAGKWPKVIEGSEAVLVGRGAWSLADVSGQGRLDFTDPAYASERASNVDADGHYKADYIKVDNQSHVGGALAFGPDGMLYISTGDASSYSYADPRTANVQEIDSLNGKILRVDPMTGAGVADNPFVDGDLSDNRSKVWALGLRNPYTMAFAADARLLIADTGWGRWEEINMGAAGANYGWPYFEGPQRSEYQYQPTAAAFYDKVASGEKKITAALLVLGHEDLAPGYQVTALVGASSVYTGERYPAAFKNGYFFTDLIDGEIFCLDIDDRRKVRFVTDVGDYGPVNFVQGPDGYIHLLNFLDGKISRLDIS